MKLTNKKKKEILKIYGTWMHSYLNGDILTYDSYFADEYHFIGSTDNEEFLNRKDTTQFFKDTAAQFSGKTDLRNQSTTIETFDNLIFITHLFDAWFLNGTEWTYYSRFRFSSVLQEKKEGWKFIYQHFSIADGKADAGETIGFDKVNEENQELREAIKRRTIELEAKNRELEIEGALERIRAQAVAMQQPSDLLDIVVTMRNEFIKLGHEAHYFWHMMWLPDKFEKAMTSGDGTKIGMIMELPRDFHSYYKGMDEWEKSHEPIMILPLETADAINYIDRMVSQGDFQLIDPNAPTEEDLRHIGGVTFIMARTTHGEIGYSLPGVVKHPPKEDLDILVRFSGAFDLAHKRFLDLQKAEAQTRETQIELALEKVRSRTMGMQQSDELRDTAMLLFQQVEELGINSFACGFNIWDEDKKAATAWMASKDRLQPPFKTNSAEDVYQLFYQAEKRGESLFVLEQKEKELEDHYKYLVTIPEVKKLSEAGLSFPKFQIVHCAYFSKGYLMFITLEPVPDAYDIFKRFAKVFEQTYTRFLDLQKAEKQAREKEIELAIEKVRSRTMAMQHSDELQETSFLLDQQVRELGINTWGCAFNIYGEKDSTEWFGNEKGILPTYTVPRAGIFKDYYKKGKKGASLFVQVIEGKACVDHYEYMSTLPVIGDVLKKLKETNNGFPNYQIDHVVYFKYGYLLFITKELVPDAHDIFKRFAKVFEQTYTRFLDLKMAENQAREAQIEAALEKVRSRSLAVHKSDEFIDVVSIVFEKLKELQIPVSAFGIGIKIEESKDLNSFVCGENEGGLVITNYRLPYFKNKISEDICTAIEKELDFYVGRYTKKTKNAFYKHVLEHTPEFKDLPEDILNMIFKSSSYSISMVASKHVVFNINNFEGENLTKHEIDILKRFSKVFNQAYIRFLDLQKAEAQAREAKIEAALEKVRSRTMAMQKGEEVKEVVVLLYKELIALGVTNFATCGYVEINEETQLQSTWVTSLGGESLGLFYLPLTGDVYFDKRYKAWKNQQTIFHQTVAGKERRKHLEYAITTFNSKEAEEMVLNQFPDPTVFYCFNFSHGYLHLVAGSLLTKEEEALLARFTKVFEQTYARFLDLEKAEAQTRAAQINLAVERVRAKALAMHKSEEIMDVVAKLKDEVMSLDIPDVVAATIFLNEGDDKVRMWDLSTLDINDTNDYEVPFDITFKLKKSDPHLYVKRVWENTDDYFIEIQNKKDFKRIIAWLREHNQIKIANEVEDYTESTQLKQLYHAVKKLNNGKLVIDLLNPPSDEMETILTKMGAAFDLAYKRFEDLQKAEAQTREAQIETALEKVRSRTMAMQHSAELPEAANNLFLQVQELGIPAWSAGYSIWEDDSKTSAWCNMSSEGEIQKAFSLPSIGEGYNFYDPYNKGETFHVSECGGKDLVKHYDFMKKLPTVGAILEELEKAGLSLPTFQIFHIVYFNFGYVMFITYETVPDAHHIFKRFGQVFEQTYTRFLDLKLKEDQAVKLEKEKQRLEKTLKDLQQTQKQLIQSEKMASLGELTAGIAHEIQNPLNFVNNFSDVSKELLEEMLVEIENGDLEEAKAIMDDVIQNLDKINHHGKRADGIVKGMLQHSRASGDKKEDTDINALADEYLRLAYHGLRAKDNSFNAQLVTDFDERITTVNVIPQDLGRVILNLLTNAFYVVNEKSSSAKATEDKKYEPTVSISTKKKKNSIEIKVSDNGNGMPDSVKEKIFQPFFTTKPTGEGTGLGLSLSYDIITKGHGGKLEVESKENDGTAFTINLPTTN